MAERRRSRKALGLSSFPSTRKSSSSEITFLPPVRWGAFAGAERGAFALALASDEEGAGDSSAEARPGGPIVAKRHASAKSREGPRHRRSPWRRQALRETTEALYSGARERFHRLVHPSWRPGARPGIVPRFTRTKNAAQVRGDLRACGRSYREIEEQERIALPVVECQIRYRHPARYDDLLHIATRVTACGPVRIQFTYEVRRAADGQLLAQATTDQACVELPSGKLVRVPAWLCQQLT